MGLGFGIGIRRRILDIDGGDRHIVCGHREVDSIAVDIHRISGKTLLDFPFFEGHALRLPCGNRNFLTKCTLFWLPVHSQGIGVLLVLRGQRDLVCGHLEGNVRTVDFRISGQAVLLPASEGVTFLLGCGNRDFRTKIALFVHAVYGQGVGDRLIDALQADVVCGHRELDLKMRAGICDFVRTLCQTFDDLPCNGIAFLLVSFKGDLIALIMLLAFLSIPVVVVLRLGRLGHNIGAYLFGGDSLIVIIRSYPDVHIVAAGGGGNSLALVGAVQQGHIRVSIVVICAGVGHRVLGGIVGKVRSLGRVADRILNHNNRTGLVLFAFLCNDGSLIAAIHILTGIPVDKGLALVYTGKALKLSREFANTVCRLANHRVVAVIVHIDVKVIQRKALKGQLFGYGVAIRQRVTAAIVVLAILHHKPDVVGTYLGGHRFRSSRQVICGAVLKGSFRDCIAEILRAVIGCSTGFEVNAEVRACRLVRPYTLIDLKFAALVQRALFGTDVHLINAVHIRMREVVELFFVVGTYKDNARLAHAFLFAGNARDERAPVNDKVILGQGREGQLFGGFAGLVYHNIRAVIATVKVQSLAVRGKLCAVISADRLAVDVRDWLGEGKHHPGIANAVNSGYICHGIAVDIGHNAIHATQLALLLTGGKVCAVDAAKAHRIGNSSLAVITRQAAKDHGVLDDHCLRCIVGQLDIVEHTGGDLSLISQFDRCVEHAAGNGAGRVEGDFLLEVSAFNNGVIELDRSIGIHTGNRHVLQRDAIALQRRLRGVDLTRGQVYRVAVRAGDEDLRLGSLLMVFVFAGHNGVLPALPLIEGDLHALTGHLLGLHAGQVGQTVFGNAQGLDRADIGGLVHQNICAVIIAGNAQHLARGRGVGVVVFNCLFVDAQHIGVQRDICSACAHQIDGIGGKGQASAVYCRNIAVAHHQLADFLPGCQCTLKVVRQRTKHGIRNGKLAVIEKGTEHTVQNNCIGNGALAVAGQGVKDTAGNFDLAGAVCRADANTSFGVGAAGDLAAGKHQSALFAKRCVRNGGIGQLNRAVDGCMAQLFEVDLSAALICHHQNAPRIRHVGIAGIGPVAAQVGFKLMFALVQAFHAGHVGHIGQARTGKAQFLAHGRDLNQLHGCVARDRIKAGRERFAICADGDRGNCHATVCKMVVSGACGQGHNAAVVTGSSYRPTLAGRSAFHHQLQIFPSTGIVKRLDDIDIPGFLPAVQGAALRQGQLVCLLLRAGAQTGDIAEKAAPDIAVLLGQLIIGAAVNRAPIQLHIGVAAVQNVDAVPVEQKLTRDHAIQQIHSSTGGIADDRFAADLAVQNVLCILIFNAGNEQVLGGIVVAPAGTGLCLGQTGSAELDLDHLIIRFRVRTNILMPVLRAVSDAVGLFHCRGRKPRPCICKCGYREDGEHHTERQYHAHDAFFHDILSFVG